MNIMKQDSIELTRLAEWIADMPVAMWTSGGPEDTLVSRPMSLLEMDEQGVLWFLVDQRSAKVEHLGRVNLSFSDPARAHYVSVSGAGAIEHDRRMIERLWNAFAHTWFPDGPQSAHLALLKFVPAAAEQWEAPNWGIVHVVDRTAAADNDPAQSSGGRDALTAAPALAANDS
jgi:general stress protein 26